MGNTQTRALPSFWKLILLLSGLLSTVNAQIRHFDYMSSCAGQEDMIDEHLYESQLLAGAAKHAIDNIAHDVVAQKLVTSYFKIDFAVVDGRAVVEHDDWNAWAKVKLYISLVDTFLKTGSYPDKRKRPQIFCNDDFLQRFPWDAAAVDRNGNYMVNSLTGQHWTIRQVYSSHEMKDKVVPYFVPDLNTYFFDTPHLPGCHPGALGETFTSMPDSHSSISPVKWTSTMDSEMVVICPEAVDGSHNFLKELGETGWVDPDSNTMLDEVVPESATLYHELYHLVTGRIGYKRNMDPKLFLSRMVNDYAVSLERCLDLDRDRAVQNAENYMYFSLAYWYFYYDWGNGKKKITFYPGYAVYWDWVQWSM